MRIALDTLFSAPKPLLGMVHLLPLPGSPGAGFGMKAILERAVADAHVLQEAGADGLMVENYGDVPFYPGAVPPETLAAITVCVREVVRTVDIPVGVNLLRNDGVGAMSVAAATGARFVRINVHSGVMVTDQGLLSGKAHETLRLRRTLEANVAIFADVWVKHAAPLAGADLEQAAQDIYERGLADGLIITGTGTGKPTDLERVCRVKRAVPEAPLFVGSGVDARTVTAVLSVADAAIVGSALCFNGLAGSGIDASRAHAFFAARRASANESVAR